jgi:signal peptidase I
MKTLNRRSSILPTLLSLFLSFMGWMILAPTQLGGSVTYVIVDGNSMEPGFHLGDLLLVRTKTGYQVGDAVTYQNEELGRFVFHRIVGTELNRFILKGDNNSWLDSYHPTQDEIVGKLWVHIPKLGRAIEWVRLPINLAITMGLLGGVLMSGTIIKPAQQRKEKNKPSGQFGEVGVKEGVLYFSGLLSLIFLGLTIFAFTRPLTQATENIPYQQEGTFSYSATGTQGVYDTELVRTGEPVFPKLTCFLNIGFTYNVLADQIQQVSGSHQLYARVLDSQSGWQRTIPLNSQTAFNGSTYSSTATLDLCQVESLANLMEHETGLHPNTYTLEIISHAEFSGIIAGAQISDSFDPSLAFKFDKVHFYIVSNDPKADPLRSAKQGLAGNSDLKANTFRILGLEPTVKSVRLISLLWLGFSLAGLVITGVYVYTTAEERQDTLVHLKYGAMLVDIQWQNIKPTSSMIDVTSIEDLARLAERHGTMILHMQLNVLHYYLVQDNDVTYRYVIGAGEGAIESEPAHNEVARYGIYHERKQVFRTGPVHNKTRAYLTSQNEGTAIRFEPLQNKISGYSTSDNEMRAVNLKAIRRDEAGYLTDGDKNNPARAKPRKEIVEYVLNTGEIGFVMPESESTKYLSKISL